MTVAAEPSVAAGSTGLLELSEGYQLGDASTVIGLPPERVIGFTGMHSPRSSSRYTQPAAAGLSGDERALTVPPPYFSADVSV